MRVCILDVWVPGDDLALENSHWVAEQTLAVLSQQAFEVTVVADGMDRAAVRAQLEAPHDGFAYFGHGRGHVLYREVGEWNRPVPLIDIKDVALVGRRWFHAFACFSGSTLAFEALDAGVAAYLGYGVAVTVEWELSQLPTEVAATLRELVTAATVRVASGERSARALRRGVRDVALRLQRTIKAHQHDLDLKCVMGLRTFANLLHQNLVFEGAEVRP